MRSDWRPTATTAVAGLIMLAAAALLAHSLSERAARTATRLAYDPTFVPDIFLALLIVFSAWVTAMSVIRPQGDAGAEPPASLSSLVRCLGLVAGCVAYVVLMPIVGFVIGSFAFCAAGSLWLGYRHPFAVLACATGAGPGLGYVFEHGFGILLPQSTLPSLF